MRSAFDGEGARLVGGRWTSAGRRAVYAASSTSLAILESLVHYDAKSMPELVVFRVDVPDEIGTTLIEASMLPDDWRTVPAPTELAAFGDQWINAAKTALLVVPSALIPTESNVLINPSHPEFERLEISEPTSLPLDKRLFGAI